MCWGLCAPFSRARSMCTGWEVSGDEETRLGDVDNEIRLEPGKQDGEKISGNSET